MAKQRLAVCGTYYSFFSPGCLSGFSNVLTVLMGSHCTNRFMLFLCRCWFSADTKQERLDWMEKLNQVLLDFHTWNRTSKSEQLDTSNSGNLRESIL